MFLAEGGGGGVSFQSLKHFDVISSEFPFS